MRTTLCVVVDTSGSMNDMGKVFVQRNLCRYMAQLKTLDAEKYAHVDIHFYQWADKIEEIVLQPNGDIPELVAGGSASLPLLLSFITSNLSKFENLRVLCLSDGGFDGAEQMKSHPDLVIRSVAIGSDANPLELEKVSSNDKVYHAEGIASAVDSIVFGNDAERKPLVSFPNLGGGANV